MLGFCRLASAFSFRSLVQLNGSEIAVGLLFIEFPSLFTIYYIRASGYNIKDGEEIVDGLGMAWTVWRTGTVRGC